MGGQAAPASAAIWRLADGVLWKAWDEELVAFCERTGSTHRFIDIAAWLVEQIAVQPSTQDELLGVASRELELPDGVDLDESLQASLTRLKALSILEQTPLH